MHLPFRWQQRNSKPTFDLHGQQVNDKYIAGRDLYVYVTEPFWLTSVHLEQARASLLQRLQSDWISGRLAKEMTGVRLIDLTLSDCPTALDRPTNAPQLVLDQPIGEIFSQANRELLILGEPGSGKTILLLQLAKALLEEAQGDPNGPLPIVLPLDAWAQRCGPLREWFIERISFRYGVPPKIGQLWLEQRQLLFLLDGLDELQAEQRVACTRAINTFRRDPGSPGLAVTCRSTDYQALPIKLQLQQAIQVQPLARAQLDAYLETDDPALQPLRLALTADPSLGDLATTPLLLSLMRQTFAITPLALGPPDSLVERRHRLFSAFVDQRLTRLHHWTQCRSSQLVLWLSWLAEQLQRHPEREFFLEHLQSSWLTTSTARHLYTWLDRGMTALLCGIIGFSAGIIYWLIDPRSPDAIPLFSITSLTIGGLFGGQPAVSYDQESFRRRSWWQNVRNSITQAALSALIGIIIGLVIIAPANIILFPQAVNSAGAIINRATTSYFVFIALFVGFFFALAGWLTGRVGLGPRSITVVEAFEWSSSHALRSTSLFLLTSGVVLFTFVGNPLAVHPSMLIGLGGAWLTLGLVGGLLGGTRLQRPPLEAQGNRGIYRSAHSAIKASLSLMLPFVAFGLILLITRGVDADGLGSLLQVLALGTPLALVSGLNRGGFACFSHLCLRIVLWRSGLTPWRYGYFLDFAVNAALLNKVSGGYSFVHPLIREHFASLARSYPGGPAGASPPKRGA